MIDKNTLRAYCGSKTGAEETFPFDDNALVFKVMGKMFALMPINAPDNRPSVSLKCDPALAQILRQTYSAVEPGYHLSKKHWNTVTVDGSILDDEIYEIIDNSYDLVVKSLKKVDRERLNSLEL
jgi:predicted DNA-binding protein (MmcQ/YjbR family)